MRPAPGRLDRPSSNTAGRSNSATANVTVDRATPAARATAETPPHPSSRASTPNSNRRCRSVNCGHNVAIRRSAASTTEASIATHPSVSSEHLTAGLIYWQVLTDEERVALLRSLADLLASEFLVGGRELLASIRGSCSGLVMSCVGAVTWKVPTGLEKSGCLTS